MGLNCDLVGAYSAGKVSGQPRAYRVEVQIPDLKMLPGSYEFCTCGAMQHVVCYNHE